MTTTVYGVVTSPPVRSVLFTAKVVDRPTELKVLDLKSGEHMKPEFLKLNPMHTVPTIDDEGFILFESNVIVTYLADKYGNNDSLYPKDLQKRAIVNQRLFLNNILFMRMRDRVSPLLHPSGDGVLKPETLTPIQELLSNLDALIGDNQWVAGTDTPSVADICLLCSFDTLELLVKEEVSSRSNVSAWLQRARSWAEGAIDIYKAYSEEAKANILSMFAAAIGAK